MRFRKLGHTGIEVSELCLGTMTFGGRGYFKVCGEQTQKDADTLVAQALEAGVNFFDTADYYSEGLAEEMLGRALGKNRKDVIVATKVYFPMGPGPNDCGLSRKHILEGCEASLGRLGTDYIDLYQVHCFDAITPLEETLETLDELVRSGKVRYIGCSNFTGWQLMKALALQKARDWVPFVTLQALYNLAARELENELLPLCKDQQLGVLPWSPLAGGFLTGKFRTGKPRPEGTRRAVREEQFLPVDEERFMPLLSFLGEIAGRRGRSVAQVALNFLLQETSVSSVIAGARTKEQLGDNLKATDWDLDTEDVAKLKELSQPTKPYPYWFQERVG